MRRSFLRVYSGKENFKRFVTIRSDKSFLKVCASKMNVSGSNFLDYYWYENLSQSHEDKDLHWSETINTLWENGKWEIPLYSVIFLLAVVGNILVILTLAKNSRMRTNTNVFLLNLAISDLILAVLCMPFTLIGTLLRDFVFGQWMCKLVPFLQATSVAASVWTLVSLSIERYYAICHPLRSRRWQTLSHAYHLIVCIWTGGAIAMLPIPVLSELQPTNKGHHKCRESWPNGDYERAYNLFLDLLLLVIPLLALGATYYLIAITLWRDLAKKPRDKRQISGRERSDSFGRDFNIRRSKTMDGVVIVSNLENFEESSTMENLGSFRQAGNYQTPDREKQLFNHLKLGKLRENSKSIEISVLQSELPLTISNSSGQIQSFKNSPKIGLRHTNYERSLTKKQRVIKMLFVVVLEFFLCWTPLYVINTLALFWPHLVYGGMGYKMISFCQLLAYTSGCCNPITYCFMNKGFRNSFINLFGCCKSK